MTKRRKKVLPKKEILKQTGESILAKAKGQGWDITPTKTAVKVDNGVMIRINCREKNYAILERKVNHSLEDKQKLKMEGNSVKSCHWEKIRKCKYKEVILTDNDIKL